MQRKVPLVAFYHSLGVALQLCPGKPSSYFPGLLNKIQGLSKTAKKNPGLFRMWKPWNVLF